MTRNSRLIFGVLGAAAAGVIIGMLMAPEKGSDMRRRMKNATGRWADKANDFFSKAKNEFEDLKEDLKEKGKNVKDDVENKVNKLKNSLD